jgi:hypothetical protein
MTFAPPESSKVLIICLKVLKPILGASDWETRGVLLGHLHLCLLLASLQTLTRVMSAHTMGLEQRTT